MFLVRALALTEIRTRFLNQHAALQLRRADAGVSAGQFTPSSAVAPAALTWSGRAEVYQADPIQRSSFVEQLDLEADGTRTGIRSAFPGQDIAHC